MEIEGWRTVLDRTEAGKLAQTFSNVARLFAYHPEMWELLKYDRENDRILITHVVGCPDLAITPRPLSREDRFNIRCWMEMHGIEKITAINDGIQCHILKLSGR